MKHYALFSRKGFTEEVTTAFLFGIEVYDNNHLFEETTRILSTHNLQEVLDRAVNNLIFKMGYLASCNTMYYNTYNNTLNEEMICPLP